MKRKVKRVIDGDTFETYTKVNGRNKVRIAGYNAPEKNQRGGPQATSKLRRIIGGETVTLIPKAGSYDRTVADVRINRKKVSNLMNNKR